MTIRRVLLVADGESVHTVRLAGAFVEAGLDVHLAAFAYPAGLPGVKIHQLNSAVGGDGRYLLAVPQLRRMIRRVRPDIVHAHYLSSYGVMAALAAAGSLVQTAWGSDLLVTAQRPVPRRLAGFALRRALLATGDSQSLLDEISRLAPGTPTHRFVFGPVLSHFGTHAKERLVLSPRNHEDNYRIDLVLDAWGLARRSLPGYRLVVAGTGSETPALRRRAREDVEFTGMLAHDDMLALVRRSALVVSVPRSDATSAAVLEALAAGCSVVATNLEANREWLTAGHLVDIDVDAAGLADAVVRCIDEPLTLAPEWSMESQVRGLVQAMNRVAGEASRRRDPSG